MVYTMTPEEEKCWRRELDMTALSFVQQELKNRNNFYTPERRKSLERWVEELKERNVGSAARRPGS